MKKTKDTTYSVLMSVYHREKPEYLRQSIQSMLDQTAMTNDFVLVCDGKLTDNLYKVINAYEEKYPDIFNVVHIDKNMGVGYAANIGLSHCKNELVAKMDSDDISNKKRCELQLEVFNKHPDITLVGTSINEFEGEPDNIVSVRSLPTSHEEICRFAKRRSPFNNQTIMFKKTDIITVGGYASINRCEDYDLFVRILDAGYKSININKPLVNYRLTSDTFKRRGTLENTKNFISIRWNIYKRGYSSFIDFVLPSLTQIFILILPIKLRKLIYKVFLRE